MTTTETRTGRYVGAPVKRKEDRALLTGRGRYLDDLTLPGQVFMAVVRSPYGHAKINGIDVVAARAAEGVVAVFTGAELAEDWLGSLPCAWPVTEDIKMPCLLYTSPSPRD